MVDALDSAVATAENRGIYYGKIQITGNYVTFPGNGMGKISYIEGKHEPENRRTEVSIVLSPIDEMGMTQLIQRSMIDTSEEWVKTVWPSLRDGCNFKNAREANDKFFKVQLVPGRPWIDKKTGEKREGTTIKFLACYPSETACKTAFIDDGNSSNARTPATTTPDSTVAAMAVDMTPNAQNPERETAKMFLPALIKSSGGNPATLANLIASMPIIAKWFTADSAEVRELMTVAA